MFHLLCRSLNDDIAVDTERSFFVGNAAGRPAGWRTGAKKDHADSDYKFALNIGCQFDVPEVFFQGMVLGGLRAPVFQPREIFSATSGIRAPEVSSSPELLVFVGRPGSGKSTYARRFFSGRGYEICNQDTLKTRDRCVKATKEALRAGRSVVVDNTNPDPETRKMYIDLARDFGYPSRCFYFTASEDLCLHNCAFREFRTAGPHIPGIAFRMYAKRFREPHEDEGFAEIVHVPFAPEFRDQELRALWCLYYV